MIGRLVALCAACTYPLAALPANAEDLVLERYAKATEQCAGFLEEELYPPQSFIEQGWSELDESPLAAATAPEEIAQPFKFFENNGLHIAIGVTKESGGTCIVAGKSSEKSRVIFENIITVFHLEPTDLSMFRQGKSLQYKFPDSAVFVDMSDLYPEDPVKSVPIVIVGKIGAKLK